VRLSWHAWPSSREAEEALAAPVGLLFTPLRPIEQLERLPQEPVRCENCAAVLNPFAYVDLQQQRWRCPICGEWSRLPPALAAAASHTHAPPAELDPAHATIEYVLPERAQDGASCSTAALLFVVDCSLSSEELEQLQTTLENVVAKLPPATLVGLITFSDAVEVHELGHPLGPRLWRLPLGMAEGEPAALQATLGIAAPAAEPVAVAPEPVRSTPQQQWQQQPPPPQQQQQPDR